MTPRTENTLRHIKSGIHQGLKKGWKGWIWLLKILIPVSLITTCLIYTGLLYKLDFIMAPMMGWLGLPASAALVLIIGIFAGIYGGVAALSAMSLAMDHMILIAVFTLIAHNLIQESAVQGKSGINPVFAAVFRLFMAFGVTFVCAKIMGITPDAGSAVAAQASPQSAALSFAETFTAWGFDTVKLVVKIFCIIMPLMVIMELAKIFNIIQILTKLISPLLAFMGLDRSTGMLWLTASIFGLAYGSAVIVEETSQNYFEKRELRKLHISIGINHAMIEDPALFLPLGLPPFWLWVPRLVSAILAAWLYSVFLSARSFYAKRACH